MAVQGKNFCASCVDAFGLLLRNPLKFGLVAVLGEIFVFLGKVFIGLSVGLIGYCIIAYTDPYKETIYSPIIPSIVSLILVIATYLFRSFVSLE
jgi:Plasma-membrane choline transporter